MLKGTLKMVKHLQKCALLTITLLFLSGCWNQVELDKIAYVVAMGIDKEEDKIRLTYLIVNPEYGTQPTGSSDVEPFQLISFVADDFLIAKNIANTIISKEISYYILTKVFISEDFAKSDELIHWLYDMTKITEIRKDLNLLVTKELAYDYLTNFHPKLERKPYKYFEEMTKTNEESSFIPSNSELFYYLRITESDNDLYLAIYSTNEQEGLNESSSDNKFKYNKGEIEVKGTINKTQYLGSAIFKKGKMIGQLTEQETILSTILNENLRGDQNIYKSFPDPFNEKYAVTTKINILKKPNVSMELTQPTPSIHVEIPLTMDVLTNHMMVDYYRNKNNREKLKRHLEDSLQQEFAQFIKKTQEEFKGEPFGWSLKARRHFKTIKQFEKFNWMESYPNMNVSIKVNIKFEIFGRQSETIDIRKVREKE